MVLQSVQLRALGCDCATYHRTKSVFGAYAADTIISLFKQHDR